MFLDRSPADDLARVRARMAELRAHEAALRAAFLENNDTGRFQGFGCDVIVERSEYEVFDITRLPDHILTDPAYYRTRYVTELRVVPKEEPPLARRAAPDDPLIEPRGPDPLRT